jgi:hypothetical protein
MTAVCTAFLCSGIPASGTEQRYHFPAEKKKKVIMLPDGRSREVAKEITDCKMNSVKGRVTSFKYYPITSWQPLFSLSLWIARTTAQRLYLQIR